MNIELMLRGKYDARLDFCPLFIGGAVFFVYFLNDVGFLIKDEKEGAGKFFNDGSMEF